MGWGGEVGVGEICQFLTRRRCIFKLQKLSPRSLGMALGRSAGVCNQRARQSWPNGLVSTRESSGIPGVCQPSFSLAAALGWHPWKLKSRLQMISFNLSPIPGWSYIPKRMRGSLLPQSLPCQAVKKKTKPRKPHFPQPTQSVALTKKLKLMCFNSYCMPGMCQAQGCIAMHQIEFLLSRCLHFGVWNKEWERESHNKN